MVNVWCTCRMIPSCEYQLCSYPAELSALVPVFEPTRGIGARFYCVAHWESILAWREKPIPGIDRPTNADEDWRPSLEDMFHHARRHYIKQKGWTASICRSLTIPSQNSGGAAE